MIFVESSHKPGVVGFVGGEVARFHSFTMCFTGLNVPAGSKLYSGVGYDVAYNRNAVIEFALGHPDIEWVQLWDDDHVFSPGTLLDLLAHDADIVVPLYTQRQPPFLPCIYKSEADTGGFYIYTPVDLEGKTGLLPVVSAGAGGIVIRRRVLEAMKAPWFERQGLIGEDHMFFKKAVALGFKPFCDLDTPIGHSTVAEVWPNRTADARWGARVELKGAKPAHVEFWDEKYRGR